VGATAAGRVPRGDLRHGARSALIQDPARLGWEAVMAVEHYRIGVYALLFVKARRVWGLAITFQRG